MFHPIRKIKQHIQDHLTFLASSAASRAREHVFHDLIATIGIDDLEKLVQLGKENRKNLGHSDYVSLAQYYAELIKNRTRQ